MNNDKKDQSLFLKIIPYLDRYGILILLLLMILALHFMQPDVFLSWRNVTNVFKQISWQSMLALGVFMVIVTAGIDLSVGSIMMFSLMLLAIVAKAGMPWYIVVLVPMLAGLLCGMFNGLGITLLRMPHPFIMTLGTLYIFRGAGNLVSGGVPISGFTDEVRYLGHGRIDLTWLGLEESQYLPVSLILIAIVYFIFWIFMNHTRIGKWIYAIGGNPNAARASGINVNKILVIVYSLCGFLSGIGALILAGRADSGYPNAGLQAELDAIAACIIGGASFFGGRGTVLGVFAGVMIMGILRNGLNLMDVSAFWQQVLIGAIIVIAVYIDVLRKDFSTRK
jgi:ribose/xylose/arabinose/galactoside ABC-type transport system permease subunit